MYSFPFIPAKAGIQPSKRRKAGPRCSSPLGQPDLRGPGFPLSRERTGRKTDRSARGGHFGYGIAGLILLFAIPSPAQVTVDLHALDQLNQGATPPKATPKKSTRHATRKESRPSPAGKTEAARGMPVEQTPVVANPPPPPPIIAMPVIPPSTAPPAAILPTGPPANVRLSPLVPEPPAAKPPPPPEPLVAGDAGGAAAPISEGVRVTFGSG